MSTEKLFSWVQASSSGIRYALLVAKQQSYKPFGSTDRSPCDLQLSEPQVECRAPLCEAGSHGEAPPSAVTSD